VDSPSAPSAIPRATSVRIESSCAGVGAAADIPITWRRTAPSGTYSAALVPMPSRVHVSSVRPISVVPPPSLLVMTVVTPCIR
jgi:hypothetical protein